MLPGRYKACMCDSTLLAGGECSETSDYKIEVGEVIVSGVNALLHDSRMNKFNCVPQTDSNGLRCYQAGFPIDDTSVAAPIVDVVTPGSVELSTGGTIASDGTQGACVTVPVRDGNVIKARVAGNPEQSVNLDRLAYWVGSWDSQMEYSFLLYSILQSH